jgi:hypothetical protein
MLQTVPVLEDCQCNSDTKGLKLIAFHYRSIAHYTQMDNFTRNISYLFVYSR